MIMINKENAILFIFIFILFIIPVIGAGCEEEEVEIPTTAPPSRIYTTSSILACRCQNRELHPNFKLWRGIPASGKRSSMASFRRASSMPFKPEA